MSADLSWDDFEGPRHDDEVMQAAMDAENRRRELASQRPGHGTPLPMEQPVAGPSVGKAGLLPVIGEGYDLTPPVVDAVSKAYGPDRPVYADDLVGGVGFVGGRQEAPITVYIGQRSAASEGVTVLSPGRPSVWQRLTGRLRGRR